SSTDPEEGAALARAFIERFSRNQVYAVITSHLSQLKSGWSEDSGVLPGSLEFDLKEGRPTYHFIPGIPGQSLALEFAKRMGVDPGLIERAHQLLSPETQTRLKMLAESRQLRDQLIELQEGLKKARQEVLEEKKKWEEKNRLLQQENEIRIEQLLHSIRKEIDQQMAELRGRDVLERHRRAQEIKAALPEMVRSFSERGLGVARGMSDPEASVVTRETFKQHFPAGTRVFVRAMNREGIVQSEPNPKGEVTVLIDSMRWSVHWGEIERASKEKDTTRNLLRKKGIMVAPSPDDLVLDLRGLSVDEALSKLDEAIDRALQFRHNRMKIIHGFGTEAIKKAVRAHLTRSPFVQKWSMGKADEGGDGVTWIDLDV
ncbi:MAG: Smr/MutS family protein, partial [Bdellovibrionaceae bacterium]|nr:Smr/MutS family protein [Pseudobdellovibrionaceae bacterium]